MVRFSPRGYDAWFATAKGAAILEKERDLFHNLLWQERGSLLDVGCGTGIFTIGFKEMGFSVIGGDISREMLLSFKEKAPNMPLLQCDAQLLPFGRGAFQYVTLITVLEFVPNPFLALLEAVRVAANGVAVAFLPSLSPLNVKRRIKSLWSSSTFKGSRFFSFSTTQSMLKEACRLNRRVITGIKKGGCLYPLGVRFLPLASFALVRVDYE